MPFNYHKGYFLLALQIWVNNNAILVHIPSATIVFHATTAPNNFTRDSIKCI